MAPDENQEVPINNFPLSFYPNLSFCSLFLLLLTSPARAGHAVGVVRREQLGGGGAPGLNIFLSITQQCMCLFQFNFCTGSVPFKLCLPIIQALRLGLENIIAAECRSQLLLNILPKLSFSPGMGGPGGPGGFTFPAPPPPYSQ